jgi:cytidyltransferase-like protein
MDEKGRIISLYLRTVRGIGEKECGALDEKEKSMLERSGERYVLKSEYRNRIKVVLVGGVFDLLHAGHIFFLNKAKALGDVLIISVGRDDHIRKKGREPLHGLDERVEVLNSLKTVDLAIPGMKDIKTEKDYLGTIQIVGPDVIALGYDQKGIPETGRAKIIRIEHSYRPNELKTSKIIKNR